MTSVSLLPLPKCLLNAKHDWLSQSFYGLREGCLHSLEHGSWRWFMLSTITSKDYIEICAPDFLGIPHLNVDGNETTTLSRPKTTNTTQIQLQHGRRTRQEKMIVMPTAKWSDSKKSVFIFSFIGGSTVFWVSCLPCFFFFFSVCMTPSKSRNIRRRRPGNQGWKM